MAALETGPWLPFELVSKVMDYVSIPELVQLSHVSSGWRRAAHAHPHFWRDIELDTTKSAALDFFLARLCAHTASINMDVACLSYQLTDKDLRRYCSVVPPAVRRNLFRTNHLSVKGTDNLCPYVCDALVEPAPMLQELSLMNFLEDANILSVPETFLGGYAPKLQKAYLSYVDLPSPAHAVTAFQNIEWLCFTSEREVAVPDILAHFPALKHLRVCLFACLEADARMTFTNHPLTTLDVVVRNMTYSPFFSAFHPSDLAAVMHLTCPASGALHWAHTLLGVLKGPLTLTLGDLGDRAVSIELSAADPAQERTRTFDIDHVPVRDEDDIVWQQIQDELFTPELLARVSRFRLLSQYVGIVPEIGEEPLAACETFELGFKKNQWYWNLPVVARYALREPQFPVLRTIICSSTDDTPAGLAVPADILSALLARIFNHRPSTLKVIELAGVQLTGDIPALEREYGCAVRKRNIM